MSKKGFIKAADVVNLKSWPLPSMKGAIVNDNQREVHQSKNEKAGLSNLENCATAEELENIRKKAYQEGFQQGIEEGKASFQNQSEELKSRFEQILVALHQPLKLVDEEVEQALLKTCLAVANQVITNEVSSSSDTILKAIQNSVSLLPPSNSVVKIKLNKADVAVVEQFFSQPLSSDSENWQLIEDASIRQGGCVVNVKASTIDASIETKMEQIARTLLSTVDDNE